MKSNEEIKFDLIVTRCVLFRYALGSSGRLVSNKTQELM
jgi:hypothetical protein